MAANQTLDISHLKRQSREQNFGKKVRLNETLAAIYFLIAVAFVIESMFDVLPNIDKSQVVNFATSTVGQIANISVLIIIVILFDYVFWNVLKFLGRKYSTENVSTRVADTAVSAQIDSAYRASENKDRKSMAPKPPEPMSLSDYEKIKNNSKFKDYLARREQLRIDTMLEVDPFDGGPTDEAILAEMLRGRRS